MQRELNELEFLSYVPGQPYNIAMVVTIRGKITTEILRICLKKLQDRHPLLSVKVVCNNNGSPWFFSNKQMEIPLTVVAPTSPDLALRLLEKEFATPFEIDGSFPLARAILIQTAHPQLILCIPHMICDGLSFAFLTRDLMSLLAQPDLPLIPLSVTEHLTTVLPSKIAKEIPKTTRKFNMLFFILKNIYKFKHRKTSRKTAIVPEGQDKSYQIYSWTLPEDLTAKLLVRCKQERVYVQSALCTAFLNFNSIISNPVNLRNRLSEPIGEALGMFASSAAVKMQYDPAKTFWKNAQLYHRKLLREMKDERIFSIFKIFAKIVPIPALQQFGHFFLDLASHQQPFAITNLGDLDRLGITSGLGEYQLESFIGGVSAGTAIEISICTLRKQLHFNICYCTYMVKQWDFPKIASTAMDILTRAL